MTAARRAVPATPVLLAALAVLLGCALLPSRAAAATKLPRAPEIIAPEAIVIEPATQDVVFGRRIFAKRPIASTTKMMTALVTLQHERLGKVFTAIDYHAQPAESVIGLQAGERMTVADLLRGLFVASANDAAATLAVDVAGSRKKFVAMMNAEAKKLGLNHTHYDNPVGLDASDNYSDAADLVKLALVLRENAFVRATTNLAHVTLHTGAHPRTLTNRNNLVVDVPYVNGVKTGHTNLAGYLLVGSATRNGVTVVSAVIDDPSEAARDSDSLALLRYGLALYHVVHPVKAGQLFGHVDLQYRDTTVAVKATKTIQRTARRDEKVTTRVVGLPAQIPGPAAAGTREGTVEVIWRGQIVARVPLVTTHAVGAATTTQKARHYLHRHRWPFGVAGALVLATVYLVLQRVRRRRRRRQNAAEAGIA